MTSQSIEQKVRQLDNDVHAIYKLIFKISTTQERHTNRLAEITEDIAAMRASVAAHDARFNALDARFDRHDARFDALDARFDRHDARFDALEGKLDGVLEILQR